MENETYMNESDLKVVPTYSVVAYPATLLPEQYRSMIFAKWLRSLRSGNPLFKNIDTKAFFDQYHQYLQNLLNKPSSVIRIAVLTETPDVVLGFSVTREDVLDYIWVYKDHRRMGIATKLFPKSITTITHLTLTAIDIWRNNIKYKKLKFNPFA